MSKIENHISRTFYNELFSKSSEEKCTAFQSMAWSLILVHENTIKNCSTNRQALSFRSLSLSLCIFYFLFHKDNETAIPKPSVNHLVYVFTFFFCFHKCFNNFHLSKNLLKSKFFQWNMCFFMFSLPWRKGVVGFSLM